MDSSNVTYRSHLVKHLPALTRTSDVSERLRFLMSQLLALVLLDLEPARGLLEEGYAHSKGGRTPRDPVTLLRSLVLMLLCGVTSINQWCRTLKGAPELRVLSGIGPQDKPPGVGTFYDFLWRLVDGPHQRCCAHHAPPSERLRGRRFLRQLEQERAQQKEQTQAELARSSQGRVEQLVNKGLAARGQALPKDVEERFNELLTRCAVVPSAALGLLGDLKRLVVSGDGTALPANADGNGHRDCECGSLGRSACECPRRYSDPEATWGYDSHRNVYFFGYRLHVISTRGAGDDLPLRLSLEGANTPDVVLGVEALLRLVKRLEQEDLKAQLWAGIWDAGYDATPFYRMHRELGIKPLIPLAQEVKTPACAQGLARSEEGTPLCPAGVPMRLHQRGEQEIVYNCPVKRPTRAGGKYQYRAREEECPRGALCEPESVLGPLVHIRLDGDPRMNLPIPRESPLFAELFKQRTATERYNSTLKAKGDMATGAYRRKHLTLAAAVLHAIGLHAQAWVDKVFGAARPKTVEALMAWCQDREAAQRQVA